MRKTGLMAATVAVMLAGCGQGPGESSTEAISTLDIAEESMSAPPPPASANAAGAAPIAVSVPKIAYVYEYGYRLSADAIAPLQMHHADLCEAQGPQVCRILDMRQSGMEGDYASGTLTLSVAADRARAFGGQLAELAEGNGGEQISSAITGENLSRQIIDTEARLRARKLLRDRLMDVLATRRGTVSELVEAERGVAQVNEEIDQAQSWLAEMQGRVAFSRIAISYTSGAPSSGGFTAPIRDALGNIASILGVTIASLITLVTVLVPIGLVGWAIWLAVRAILRRRRGRNAAEIGAAERDVAGTP